MQKNLRIEWHWQLKLANNYNVHGIPIKETKEKKDYYRKLEWSNPKRKKEKKKLAHKRCYSCVIQTCRGVFLRKDPLDADQSSTASVASYANEVKWSPNMDWNPLTSQSSCAKVRRSKRSRASCCDPMGHFIMESRYWWCLYVRTQRGCRISSYAIINWLTWARLSTLDRRAPNVSASSITNAVPWMPSHCP